MGSIQIILGRTRNRRRAAIAHAQVSGLDVHGHPNFLYLTDTQRKQQLVQDEFVHYRGGGTFLPSVDTVSGVLALLVERFGDGRAVWTPGAQALVAERVIQQATRELPWLNALGSPAAEALSATYGRWNEANFPTLGGSHPSELNAALARLHRALGANAEFVGFGDALRALCSRLLHPPAALAGWLRRVHAVVIDDVLHPSAMRREALVALARAWRTLGVHVLISFESGRGLGGAEAGRFFEYDDCADVAFALRPFAATRAFRRQLFADLVAEDGAAEIFVAARDGALVEVASGETYADPDPPDVADCLQGPAEVFPEQRGLEVHAWPDPTAEVRAVAIHFKQALIRGEDPEQLWVAFPGLPGYLPIIARIFDRLGVPYEAHDGVTLLAHPAASALVQVLTAPAAGFPLGALIAAFAHPVVNRLDESQARALARAFREAGIDRGGPDQWQPRLSDRVDSAAIERLVAAIDDLGGLAEAQTASAWRERVHDLLRRWNLPEYWRMMAAGDPGTSLVAVGQVLEVVESVALDAHAASLEPWDSERLASLLRNRAAARSLRGAAAEGGRVQVVGILDIRGIHPKHLWIGGLLAADFPARPTEDFLLARADRGVLDELEPAVEGRYLIASAIRNAAERNDGGTLILSWPTTRDGAPSEPSPLLEDVLDVVVEGDRTLRSRVVHHRAPPEGVWGPDDLDGALGAWTRAGADPGPWAALAGGAGDLPSFQRALAARSQDVEFTVYDGILNRPPALPTSIAVTAIESYLGCPMRYFHARLLGVDAETPHDPDLDAATRGSLVHLVLHRFMQERVDLRMPPLAALEDNASTEGTGDARTRLYAIALELLAEDPDFKGLTPALAEFHRTRWVGGLVDEAPRGLLRSWLDAEQSGSVHRSPDRLEWKFSDVRYGKLSLRGVVDRADRIGDGQLVVDYKTGRAPSRRQVERGLKVQGLVYLDAVAPDGAAASVYQELRGASRLTLTGWMGDGTVCAAAGATPREVLDVGGPERRRLGDALTQAGERLALGVFHTTLAGAADAGCEWCEFQRSCRVDPERNARIAVRGDPRWQAPMGAAAEEPS